MLRRVLSLSAEASALLDDILTSPESETPCSAAGARLARRSPLAEWVDELG